NQIRSERPYDVEMAVIHGPRVLDCGTEDCSDLTTWRGDMDIERGVRGLGLQQYVTTFRDNAIDAEILSELTEADLEKLGVVLGHRKRLLKAIATLTSPAALAQATPVGPSP